MKCVCEPRPWSSLGLHQESKNGSVTLAFYLKFQIHHGVGLPGEKAHYKTSEVIYMLPSICYSPKVFFLVSVQIFGMMGEI